MALDKEKLAKLKESYKYISSENSTSKERYIIDQHNKSIDRLVDNIDTYYKLDIQQKEIDMYGKFLAILSKFDGREDWLVHGSALDLFGELKNEVEKLKP